MATGKDVNTVFEINVDTMKTEALTLVMALQCIISDAAPNAYILSEQFVNDVNALKDEDVLFVFDNDETEARETLSLLKNIINFFSNEEYREEAKNLMAASDGDGNSSIIRLLLDAIFKNGKTLEVVRLGNVDETGAQPLTTLPLELENTPVPMLLGYVNDFEYFRKRMLPVLPLRSYYVSELLRVTVNCYNAIVEAFLSSDRIDAAKLSYCDGQIQMNSDAHHFTVTRNLITTCNDMAVSIQEDALSILEIMENQPVEKVENKPETRKNKGGRHPLPERDSIADVVKKCSSDEDACVALDRQKIPTPGDWIKKGCPRSWMAARNDEAKDESSRRIWRENIRKMFARYKTSHKI